MFVLIHYIESAVIGHKFYSIAFDGVRSEAMKILMLFHIKKCLIYTFLNDHLGGILDINGLTTCTGYYSTNINCNK